MRCNKFCIIIISGVLEFSIAVKNVWERIRINIYFDNVFSLTNLHDMAVLYRTQAVVYKYQHKT